MADNLQRAPTAVCSLWAEASIPQFKLEPRVLEDRIIELEVKNAFLGDALDQLNAVVVRQQQQIDLLIREVMALKAQAGASDVLRPDNLAEEIPPHY